MDSTQSTRGPLLLLVPILVVAVVAALWAVSSRGDAAFQFDQEHPSRVSPSELEALVAKAREPTPQGPGSRARRARCVALDSKGAHRRWRCTVHYASGKLIRYRVTLKPDGSYVGVNPSHIYFVRGCCVHGVSGASG